MTVYLFDNNKILTAEVQPGHLLQYTQKTALNGLITASLTSVYSEDIEAAYYFGSKDVDDGNIFWMYRITSFRKYDGKVDLTGHYILFDELQAEVVRDVRPQSVSALVALERILTGSLWKVGNNHSSRVGSSSYYFQSRLSAFWDYLDKWRVEFRPRLVFLNGAIVDRFIDIYDEVSDDYGKWYEYGDKLLTVTAEQANEGIYTALIGLGKGEEVGDGFGRKINFEEVQWRIADGNPVDKPGGQDYVSLPQAVSVYGHRETVIEFPEIEDREELLMATYSELLTISRPKVEFQAQAIEDGLIEPGETVTIIRDDLGIRYKTRVFEVERNFLDKKIKSFSFGDKVRVTTADRIKASQKSLETQSSVFHSLYDANRQAVLETYHNENSFDYTLKADNPYGLPAGRYSFNAPIDEDPTSVIYTGAGKILIADSKLPDGSWNFTTFGTGKGLGAELVTAENIAANSIGSEHIATGALTSGMISVGEEGSLSTLEEVLNAQQAFNAENSDLINQIRENADAAFQGYQDAQSSLDEILSQSFTDGILSEAELSAIAQAESALELAKQHADSAMSELEGLLNSKINELDGFVRTYIRTDTPTGDLIIGKEGNPVQMRLTNDRLSFEMNGVEVAYFADRDLMITDVRILNALNLGGFVFEPRDSGNLSFYWKG